MVSDEVPDTGTHQQAFITPEDKTRGALEIAEQRDYDHVIALVSGGTDSLCAVDAYDRWHDDYDLPSIDVVVQTNTGTTLPSTLETAREYCADRGFRYIEVRNQYEPDEDQEPRMLAPRVLENGFPSKSQGGPGSGGHWPEFTNRKQDTWDKVYSGFPGQLLYISGARVDESDRRAANLGDGAVDFGESGDRHPRKTWLAPIHGWLDEEKERYIEANGIPETPAYDWLGYSGDCTACSFDDPRVLNEIRIMCPELAYALELLVVWVYQRIRRGEIDQPIERCVWGTELDADPSGHDECQRSLKWGGCSEPNCKASKAGGVND